MVYQKLWLPLDGNKGGPIFWKVLVTFNLVEMRHKSIQLLNNTIWNGTILFIFFDISLLLRSTTKVTTENLSLNKWKTWSVEFYEDCKKCEKTLGGENSNSRGKFRYSKIVEPAYNRDRQIQKFFWSILIYEMSKLFFLCECYGCYTNGLRIRG